MSSRLSGMGGPDPGGQCQGRRGDQARVPAPGDEGHPHRDPGGGRHQLLCQGPYHGQETHPPEGLQIFGNFLLKPIFEFLKSNFYLFVSPLLGEFAFI